MAKIASRLQEPASVEREASRPVETEGAIGLESRSRAPAMTTVTPPPAELPKAPRRARGRRTHAWGPFTISLLVHGVAIVLVILTVSHITEEEKAPLCVECVQIVDLHPQEEADAISDELPTEDPVDITELEPLETPVDSTPEQPSELPEIAPDTNLEVPTFDAHEVPLHAVKQRRPAPAPAAQPPVARPSVPRVSSRPARRPARTRTATKLKLVSRPNLMRYYPEEARRQGIQGEALIEIVVDTTGKVTQATLVRSSGSQLLDRQAIRVMYAYRFEAGAGGKARVPVNFRLR